MNKFRCARQKLVTSAAASTGADSHRVVSHPSDRRIFSLLWDLNYSAAECAAARQTTTEAGFDAGLRICWISAVTRSRIAVVPLIRCVIGTRRAGCTERNVFFTACVAPLGRDDPFLPRIFDHVPRKLRADRLAPTIATCESSCSP